MQNALTCVNPPHNPNGENLFYRYSIDAFANQFEFFQISEFSNLPKNEIDRFKQLLADKQPFVYFDTKLGKMVAQYRLSDLICCLAPIANYLCIEIDKHCQSMGNIRKNCENLGFDYFETVSKIRELIRAREYELVEQLIIGAFGSLFNWDLLNRTILRYWYVDKTTNADIFSQKAEILDFIWRLNWFSVCANLKTKSKAELDADAFKIFNRYFSYSFTA